MMIFRKPGGRDETSASQRLVTISLVTSLTLVVMVLALAWGRASHNNAVQLEDSKNIVAAAHAELKEQVQELAAYVEDTLLGRSAGLSTPQFTKIFIIDMDTNIPLAMLPGFLPPEGYAPFAEGLSPSLERLRDRFDPMLRGSLTSTDVLMVSSGNGGFLTTPLGAFGVSIVSLSEAAAARLPLPDAKRLQLAVVGLRLYGGEDLSRLAFAAGTGALTLVDRPSDDPSLATTPIDSSFGVLAQWHADRPGDRLVGAIGSLLVSFAALFAGLIAYHTTMRLADSEASALRMAGHDLLSGIPNRLHFLRMLDAEISRIQRRGGGLALLSLDLDRFKDINDTFGHDVGDRLIVAVAARLSKTLRGGDVVARFGGDEFAILQVDATRRDNCETLANRVLALLREPFDLGGQAVSIGSSIGIAMFPRDTDDREILMRCADLALYEAKHAGRNRFAFFESSMSDKVQIHTSTEADLRRAIEEEELLLEYQPVVSVDGTRLLAVEALIRWPHPEKGMILPRDFIALAESRGLALPLGEWVLRRACRDALQWKGLRVAINVSTVHFLHPGFVAMVGKVLADTGLAPECLELEVTETVLLHDEDLAAAAMAGFRQMGVRLALDDFGTGYSSMIYLRRFAIDKIKIDRSFLQSLGDSGESAIIVHSVVHLGRALGLAVSAEGVETREQHRFLQALGAEELQGFLFSRPVGADAITAIVASGGIMPVQGEDSAADAAPPARLAGAA